VEEGVLERALRQPAEEDRAERGHPERPAELQAIDRDESFELLLDLFVDGLAKRASSESGHGTGSSKRQAARPTRRGKP
jgi:hypothetical protein